MADEETFTIDGEEYKVASLTVKGRECIESVKFVDNELAKLNARISVLNTARAAYFITLKDEMAKKVDWSAASYARLNYSLPINTNNKAVSIELLIDLTFVIIWDCIFKSFAFAQIKT